ncbi:MAG TPA: hypothetical protein DCQ64_21925 [Candidatus Rokubacteria bacterium]|nr:hypothetical protein [Candidatus Rokubacteria bacterium]
MDPFGGLDETIGTLPVGRGATLPTGAGAAQPQGNAGETVTVPKTDWVRALMVAGLALKDMGSAMGGKPTNFLMEHMMAEEGIAERKAAGQRAERADKRSEEQLGLQKKQVASQERAQFLNELLTIAPRLYTASDEDRNKSIGALEQRASEFGLQPIVRGLTGDAKIAKLAGEYAPLLTKYGTEGLGLVANQLFAKGDSAGALKLIEDHMKPFALQEALTSMRNVITNLSEGDKRPSYGAVLDAVRANSPLYARTIVQNSEFFNGVFALSGIKTPKVAEVGAEAGATRETPTETAERAKLVEFAKLDPKIQARLLEQKRSETEMIEEIKARHESPKRGIDAAKAIRNDFLGLPSVKTLQQAVGALGQMEQVFKGPHTTAADWSLIVGFAKINDPDSVAREGEQAAVRGLASVDERIANAYDLFLKKKLLPQNVRTEILDASRRLVAGRSELHRGVETEFKGIAKRQGADPADAVPDITGGPRTPPVPKAESLSRKDARYKQARARGLSDEEIEQRFNLRLTD